MASVPDAALLALYVAEGCAKIMVPLLCFLGGPSPRSPAVDEAVVILLVVLPMAYVAGVIVEHFAGVVLAYLHLAAPPPPASATTGSSVHLGRFFVLLFVLVFSWLLAFAVQLAAFVFLGAGKRGTDPWFSWNVLG